MCGRGLKHIGGEFVPCENRGGQVGDRSYGFDHKPEVPHHSPRQFVHEYLEGLEPPYDPLYLHARPCQTDIVLGV